MTSSRLLYMAAALLALAGVLMTVSASLLLGAVLLVAGGCMAAAAAARLFQQKVDAACVDWNAPTSFTDGAQFGLGAEIGISTQKLGPRGPMGLDEICTYKWIIEVIVLTIETLLLELILFITSQKTSVVLAKRL